MQINTALILCAGLGKRLNPLTLKTPKPLLELDNVTILERCINIILKSGVKKIFLNTFHLENQIFEFIKNKNFPIDIQIIQDGKEILDTGGGILNLINSSEDENFIIFNPDTMWDIKYIDELKSMIEYYDSNKLNNLLLVVNKKKSFDKRFIGDFELKNKSLFKYENNNFIYIGCQIINKKILNNISDTSFSISKVWNNEISKNNLNGFESTKEFFHVTDLEIFNEIIKS